MSDVQNHYYKQSIIYTTHLLTGIFSRHLLAVIVISVVLERERAHRSDGERKSAAARTRSWQTAARQKTPLEL